MQSKCNFHPVALPCHRRNSDVSVYNKLRSWVAQVVLLLCICSPGARSETALRATQRWEFPFPGKFLTFLKNMKLFFKHHTEWAARFFKHHSWRHKAQILRRSQILLDCQTTVSSSSGIRPGFCTQHEFIFNHLVFVVPNHMNMMYKNKFLS